MENVIAEIGSIVKDLKNKNEILTLVQKLITEKEDLAQTLESEKLKLKQRSHELSVIYSTSSALNYSLSYPEITLLIMNSLYSVMSYEICSIYLHNYNECSELFLRTSPYIKEDFILSVVSNIYNNVESFIQSPVIPESVKENREEIAVNESINIKGLPQELKSFINIPISFKGEIFGVISLCSIRDRAFPREKVSFAYTLVNQLATVLGRLKLLIESEKQRINHLVEHLQDAVIIVDTNHAVLAVNKEARQLFSCENNITPKKLKKIFDSLDIATLIDESLKAQDKGSSHERILQKGDEEKTFLINIDPIISDNSSFFSGIAVILRDISYLKNIEKEKTKKIAVINRARELINSITNQEKLFSILGDYILNVANAHLGALSFVEANKLNTKSSWVLPSKAAVNHISEFEANFPDSIEFITLKDGENLLKKTIHEKKTLVLRNFPFKSNFLMEDLGDEVDIILKELITVPLMTKKKVIGILTIVKKALPDTPELTKDDIETLETIASLSATAIENANLYQQTLLEQKIQQELKVAHEIQRRILPKKLPQTHNMEFGSISIPAHGIGGDYYDFYQINQNDNNSLGVAIVDVVGKGIPAALITIMIKSILQTHVIGNISPCEVIKAVNIAVLNEPAITKFVPMFYCVIDSITREFRYTNAGHELPLFFDAQTDEFDVLDTEGFPVGGMEDIDYEEKKITLNPGDIISVATDGIVEARDPQGNAFGGERLRNLIKKYKHLPANKIVDKIYTHVIDFVKDAPQHDDITLVIIKAKDSNSERNRPSSRALWQKELTITSDTKHVKTIRDLVGEAAEQLSFDPSVIYDLKLAVNEAHANIIKHAYNKDPDQTIIFKATVYKGRVDFFFKDYGRTSGELAIKQVRSLDDFQGNGLGVFLIKSTMDDVTYNILPGEGTELTMIKYVENHSVSELETD